MRAVAGLAGLALAATSALPPAAAAVGWSRYELADPATHAWRYLPASVREPAAAPVVVFLHGAGNDPRQWQEYLAPFAEELGLLLLLPAAGSAHGWGVAADHRTVEAALWRLREEGLGDPARTAVAGYSSGGAFAYVLAYAGGTPFSGVFALGAPYRTVLELRAAAAPPLRLYWGAEDPNALYRAPLTEMFGRLGVPVEVEVRPGFGHASWPDEVLRGGLGFLAEQRLPATGPCLATEERLCLGAGRFAVEARWRDHGGRQGRGRSVPLQSADSGLLWFFSPENWELMVKVLDGCALNGHRWVFLAATTDVGYTVSVRDLETGEEARYENEPGRAAPAVTDTRAFGGCP